MSLLINGLGLQEAYSIRGSVADRRLGLYNVQACGKLAWSLAFFIFAYYKVRRSVVNLPNAIDNHNPTVRARKKRFKNSLNPNAASILFNVTRRLAYCECIHA